MKAYTIPPSSPIGNAPPMIGVYQEALDHQKKRTSMLRDEYYSRAMDAARPLAFTITGLQTQSSLLEAHRLGEQLIAANMTMSDYADLLGEVVDGHGGTILPPSRFELIHHNTMATNNAAGAWRQMTDPDVVGERSYFKYVTSSDACKICSPLKGLIVHYTDPVLKHLWNPQHHWCACEWISLANEDVDESQVYRSPEGYEYPVIDGRMIHPATGWDFNPAEAFAADDTAFTRAAAELNVGGIGREKKPADYGLGALLETDQPPAAPDLPRSILDLETDAARFERIFGFVAGAERTIALDYATDGLWITTDTFGALASAASDDDRTDLFALVAATIQQPAEVWFVPAADANGATSFVKRYLGVFSRGKDRVAVWLDRSPQGWAMAGGRADAAELEKLRRGLLTYTRVGRKS